MVKLFSCKAHDGDYFWLRYKHDEEKLYHNLVIDGGRKSNASDFYEMLKHICKNGEQIDAMVFLLQNKTERVWKNKSKHSNKKNRTYI